MKSAERPLGLTNWSSDLKDFADTAALIENLDLVVTVDTSIAHLSAALGKKTWMLNRLDTDFRWLLDRPDSPWYPTLRIFRQKISGDWIPVISEVQDGIIDFLENP